MEDLTSLVLDAHHQNSPMTAQERRMAEIILMNRTQIIDQTQSMNLFNIPVNRNYAGEINPKFLTKKKNKKTDPTEG